MADNAVNRLGQINNLGVDDALFLKIFGEVLASFQKTTTFMDRHMNRTISSGRSAQFPVLGRTTARYHTPGTEITGGTIAAAERTLTVDGLLISDITIAEIDEMMNHYETRREYTRLLGEALSQTLDLNIGACGLLAARSSAVVTGGVGGAAVTEANAKTDGAKLAAAIFAANVALDEKWVSEGERTVFVKPAQYALLAQTTALLNKDWGGAGVYADGSILRVGGSEIVKTNNLPSTAITGTYNNKYNVDASNTAALLMQRAAVGTLTLIGIRLASEWSERRQSTLMVAKTAVGHGVLRPECAVEIKTA